MTKCKVCHGRYNNRLRQWCPFCGASNPVMSQIFGFIMSRNWIEIVRG